MSQFKVTLHKTSKEMDKSADVHLPSAILIVLLMYYTPPQSNKFSKFQIFACILVENSCVDPNQLASKKPADLDLHFFPQFFSIVGTHQGGPMNQRYKIMTSNF